MKKAYEYLDTIQIREFMTSDDTFYKDSDVERLIITIQKESYNQAIRDASIKCDDPCLDYLSSKLIKQLILNLKKN